MSDYTGKVLTKAEVDSADFGVIPMLSSEEHAWIEGKVGRTLTNEEAQAAIREATLQASWALWMKSKGESSCE